MSHILKPQSISGFPEHLPEVRMIEQKLLDTIRRNYELAGFVNIETPAVERTEVLTSKGADDKEIYAVGRLHNEETGQEDKIALHFDLTVPMARYVAQHYNDLTFPFRRYQIQKVWRGERAQSGRYREFYQADIDIIGDETLPLGADTEVLTTINNVLSDLNIGSYTIRVNNRKVIVGFVKSIGVGEDHCMKVIGIIDKMPKVGEQAVRKLLVNIGLNDHQIEKLIDFCLLTRKGSEVVLSYLSGINHPEAEEGYVELKNVYDNAIALGVDPKRLVLDPAIARGLGYYTGTICETFLDGHESLGSICSGGRYENLASYFTEKKLPGVGVSIGVSRLLSRLLQMNQSGEIGPQTPSKVLVTRLQKEYENTYLGIVRDLREAGVPSEIYLDPMVKIGKQLGYANRKGIPYAIVAGGDEISKGEVQLKHMYTGDREQVAITHIASRVSELLSTKN